MRILVLGSVGAGKTTLALKISEKFGLPVISSDEIVWDSEWKRRSGEEVGKKLKFFKENDSWIFEGTLARNFVERLGLDADVLILLDYSKRIIFRRIFSRYRRGRVEKSAYGKLWSLCNLVFWMIRYSSKEYFDYVNGVDGARVFVLRNEGDELVLFEKLVECCSRF